jgi:acyl carrier protein
VTREEIRNVVVAALKGVAPELQPATLDPGESLREQLEIDSFDFLAFVIALDKALAVAIPESDYRKLISLDACVDYLAARLQQRSEEKGARR